jgi:hypothetical protein
MHPRLALVFIRLDEESVQRRGTRPGIDLRLDVLDTQAGQRQLFAPAEYRQVLIVFYYRSRLPQLRLMEQLK